MLPGRGRVGTYLIQTINVCLWIDPPPRKVLDTFEIVLGRESIS